MLIILAALVLSVAIATPVGNPPAMNVDCPLVRCMPCAGSYAIDDNGCQTCTCQVEKRQACSGVMCMMFCINGFKTDSNGCEICSCA